MEQGKELVGKNAKNCFLNKERTKQIIKELGEEGDIEITFNLSSLTDDNKKGTH